MILLNIFDSLRQVFENPSELFDPEHLLQTGGLALLILLTFAQTGIFFFFFIPGDAILFTAGVLISTQDFQHNIIIVCVSLVIAAFLGNLTGYWLGKKAGPKLRKRKEGWLYKPRYLSSAEAFYQKHGVLALSFGMFFMIVRTFSPIVAGIIGLDFRKMMIYSLIGAVTWISLLVLSGYFLGRISWVEEYLEYVILGMVLTITIPPIIKYFSGKKNNGPSN